VKSVLLDQRRMAGLGNIYADEALFEARVRPDTPAGDLSLPALRRLHAAVRAVLERGIENRGASFRDYVDGSGNAGRQQMLVQVFRRTGKPCYVCGSEIKRTVIGGRSTHFCPKCQPRARRRPSLQASKSSG
jgi:formamidopyrimidine-DNA glycosylase